ncbi:hypothetical protein ACET3X_004945 [Alternaria dauci]|uniref:Transcription factor domain-containing protein n=1 Tax=Alternaria dauci TaxID=48095 RepID=A0ABR3UJ63_9PLEO
MPKYQPLERIVTGSSPVTEESELLHEISMLQTRAKELERHIVRTTVSAQHLGHSNGETSLSQSGLNLAEDYPEMIGQPEILKVDDIVGHLKCVSMGQSSLEAFTDELDFNIGKIRSIPQAPAYTIRNGRLAPCIWLPTQEEAMKLLDYYVTELNYIQHVTHYPSLAATFDEVYRQIESFEPVQSGKVVLLLGIIAHTTYAWTAPKNFESERPLFLSSSQARSQTPIWIKAAYTALNASQEGSALVIETIQGLIVLSYVICSIEGVSLRYRCLISTGLLFGRELGLHRSDHESNATMAGTLKVEIGRRVWWYLTATDWLLAARYGGSGEDVYQSNPLHMSADKPININDIDLTTDEPQQPRPLSQQTDMSYFLQRIRLSEISRNIVDQINSDPSNRCANIMAMDHQLVEIMNEVPAFLLLDSYQNMTVYTTSNHSFVQAYLLNTLLHTQRCKLHLATLTRTSTMDSTYASSHAACLQSARQLLHIETTFLRSQPPFASCPQQPPAGLYGIFIATITLLMDACLNKPSELSVALQEGDLVQGLRMIANAREGSLAAAELYESLMQILGRYTDTQHPAEQNSSAASNHTTANTVPGLPSDVFREQQSSSSQIDDVIHLDLVGWDDLFSSVSSSPFF